MIGVSQELAALASIAGAKPTDFQHLQSSKIIFGAYPFTDGLRFQATKDSALVITKFSLGLYGAFVQQGAAHILRNGTRWTPDYSPERFAEPMILLCDETDLYELRIQHLAGLTNPLGTVTYALTLSGYRTTRDIARRLKPIETVFEEFTEPAAPPPPPFTT
jgi:hypothetical protein